MVLKGWYVNNCIMCVTPGQAPGARSICRVTNVKDQIHECRTVALDEGSWFFPAAEVIYHSSANIVLLIAGLMTGSSDLITLSSADSPNSTDKSSLLGMR